MNQYDKIEGYNRVWKNRLDTIDDWLYSMVHKPQKYMLVFNKINHEYALNYPSQILWRGFTVWIDSEEKMEKYRSVELPVFAHGNGRCQSWSQTSKGSKAWMRMGYEVVPDKQENIKKPQGYIFIVSAEIKSSEILIDVQNDLSQIINPSRFDSPVLKNLAKSVHRKMMGMFKREKEMIVLSHRKEIPTLSREVFRIRAVK